MTASQAAYLTSTPNMGNAYVSKRATLVMI